MLTAPKCREHNDSNVLCLGSWVTDNDMSIEIVDEWLNTNYGEKRHVRRVEKLNRDKKDKIVFANGVFDILHAGHIELLRFAKNLGGKLIVAVNSDRSVKQLKGDSRPINPEMDRLKLIQSLKWVDDAFVFDSCDTGEMIDAIHPDIVVKGGEWTADEVRSRDNIPNDIDIKIFPLKENYSTTDTLKKVTSWQKKSS
jgi:D-beta-D-heptose 7-phosphate kinase/D-beta-D-heptose 1-phosphate adenosyltransferase